LIRHLQLPAEKVKSLPLRNALDPQSARALARLVKQQQIDVVHAHMARDYSLAAYATRRNRQTKFIVTRHVLFALNRLHRRTLSQAARVIAVSSAVARELHEQRIVSDNQIALIPNGVDVDRFARAATDFDRAHFLQSKDVPANCLLVGSLGELRPLKRHDDFIRAAAIVASKIPKAHFVLAGVDTSTSGDVRKQLERLVADLDLQDRFHFLGWLDDADRLLCALDVFVSASQTESFGLVITEAMAAGTAVVATMTEGAREIIADQETGLLVPIGDVERMAESITALLTNEGQRLDMSARAKDAVSARFSLKRMVDQIEKLYME
jgi:glycosyltransferase involved in cell wall biosynthesis